VANAPPANKLTAINSDKAGVFIEHSIRLKEKAVLYQRRFTPNVQKT